MKLKYNFHQFLVWNLRSGLKSVKIAHVASMRAIQVQSNVNDGKFPLYKCFEVSTFNVVSCLKFTAKDNIKGNKLLTLMRK